MAVTGVEVVGSCEDGEDMWSDDFSGRFLHVGMGLSWFVVHFSV